MNLLVCLLVILITGTLVIKKFKAQTVLLLGGFKESYRDFIF